MCVCVYLFPVEYFVLHFFSCFCFLFLFEIVSVFAHPIQLLINTNKLPKFIFPFPRWAYSTSFISGKKLYFKNIFYGVVLRMTVNNIILHHKANYSFFLLFVSFYNSKLCVFIWIYSKVFSGFRVFWGNICLKYDK